MNFLSRFIKEEGMLFLFIAIFFGIFSIFVPYFFTRPNFISLLLAISQIGMVAGPMAFCLASKDFDLSVGSQVAFAGVFSILIVNATQNIALSLFITLTAGLVFGILIGIIVTKFHINAFITTLSAMEIIRGLTYIISKGRAVGLTVDSFKRIGGSAFLGLTVPTWTMLLCLTLFGLILHKTRYGKEAIATGGNMDAAWLSGIDTDKIRILNFTIQGLVCAIAGIILSSRLSSGQPNAAIGFEFSVISSCILGGVSLSGGKATILSVILGVVLLGMIQNVLNLLNIETFYQYVIRGLILLIAVGFDQYKLRLNQAA